MKAFFAVKLEPVRRAINSEKQLYRGKSTQRGPVQKSETRGQKSRHGPQVSCPSPGFKVGPATLVAGRHATAVRPETCAVGGCVSELS